MPRAVAKAAQTVEAVNGPEYDRATPEYFEEEEDVERTVELEGRYKIVTPLAVNFSCYGVEFRQGIGRTDDLDVANRIQAEFKYKVLDTQKTPVERVPVPAQALPEET
jgi:hypothetical protein